MLTKEEVIPRLLNEFSDFQPRWERYSSLCDGESCGLYIDMTEVVHFVVEDLYVGGQIKRVELLFKRMEEFLNEGDQDTRDLVGLGFFETLQCVASHRPYGQQAFIRFLGPLSSQVWQELDAIWDGKSSLADVVRAERKRSTND